ncbi:MAG: radical SAM family heme chaperone HemW [Pseudomonadota bacterium]
MSGRAFGLYIHWPFCQAKCPYCDFNSHVAAEVEQEKWLQAYVQEIQRVSHDLPDGILSSIFFGGGTPSLMAPSIVDAVISAARSKWRSVNDVEITLEANPTSVESGSFAGFAGAGVNRVSIGVQALRDDDLRRLGRMHSSTEAIKAIELAHAYFDRVSFDLIYARQDQSLNGWEEELRKALELATDHLSLYQLTIEPGTVFSKRAAAGYLGGLPDEDLAADMYELTQELTSSAGLQSYEVSNYATPGFESRHNLIYWRGGDWLGIGPGAHGRFTKNGKRVATECYLDPKSWLEAVVKGDGESRRATLDGRADIEERLMMGLRLSDGIPLHDFSVFLSKFSDLSEIKMLEVDDNKVRATRQGRLVLNSIIREVLA